MFGYELCCFIYKKVYFYSSYVKIVVKSKTGETRNSVNGHFV
jgi:hypothetical protein